MIRQTLVGINLDYKTYLYETSFLSKIFNKIEYWADLFVFIEYHTPIPYPDPLEGPDAYFATFRTVLCE